MAFPLQYALVGDPSIPSTPIVSSGGIVNAFSACEMTYGFINLSNIATIMYVAR